MAHVNYKELQYCVENFQPYTHGSSHAINSNNTYTIISYDTPIAVAEKEPNGTYTCRLLSTKFSATTSRLQNIIRRAWKYENLTEVNSLS